MIFFASFPDRRLFSAVFFKCLRFFFFKNFFKKIVQLLDMRGGGKVYNLIDD